MSAHERIRSPLCCSRRSRAHTSLLRAATPAASRRISVLSLALCISFIVVTSLILPSTQASPLDASNGDALMHFSGLRELSGRSYRAFKNRFRRHLGDTKCLSYHAAGNWWHYEWCIDTSVVQFHPSDDDSNNNDSDGSASVTSLPATPASSIILGRYTTGTAHQVLHIRPLKHLARLPNPDFSGYTVQQTYASGDVCVPDAPQHPQPQQRTVEITYKCCAFRANDTYIETIDEPLVCSYRLTVCSPIACGLMQRDQYVLGASTHVSDEERLVLAATVKDMFYHAYNGYMTHAFPLDNLLPLTCKGETFELGKIQMLTLIDTLDTLAMLDDAREFQRAVALVVARADFALDTEVSVFETTIRVLGGLLSAHLFAIDPQRKLFPRGGYDKELLALATDLGERLLPAFATPTGIPFGTVNLRFGVPHDETPIASTAGAGSLTLEFTMLSVLTGDPKFANAARGATRALFQRRSPLGLLGKHIDTRSGDWTETLSGPGSNSDSFYEYLLKMYMLFNDEESLEMFATVYPAVLQHNLHGDWYADVSMWSGCHYHSGNSGVVFENLAAFWPGMQASIGHVASATKSMNSFYRVWRDFGFIPEQFNVLEWKPLRGRGARYPLRPELIESTFYLHEATQDASWLRAGAHVVHSLQKHAKTTCGYATIADIETKALEDHMPSFFLSETLKYLLLLFNTTHFYRRGTYVMTTEAHPFPILPARLVDPILFADAISNATNATDADGRPKHAPVVFRSAYTMSQLQCAPQRFLDRFDYQLGYESAPVAKTARCQPTPSTPAVSKTTTPVAHASVEDDTKAVGKPLGHFQLEHDATASVRSVLDALAAASTTAVTEPEASSHRSDTSFKTLYGGARFGHFRLDQLEHAMRFTREDTGEWIEASGLGDAAHLLVSTGKDHRRDDDEETSGDLDARDADLEFTTHLVYAMAYDERLVLERSCRLHVRVTPMLEIEPRELQQHTRRNLQHSFPCVGAGFGVTDSVHHSEQRRLPSAEVVIATPLDACGWLANDNVAGKIVLAARGVCFFESKARNAAARGAVGVIIVNNEDDDRVMVMGGSGDAIDDDDADASQTTTSKHLDIPVVMVPQRLGAWFDRQLSVAAANNELLTIELELTVRDTTTASVEPTTAAEGEETATTQRRYPFVEGAANDLRVYGPEWGVHLQRTTTGGTSHQQQRDAYSVTIVETPVQEKQQKD